LLSDFIKGKTQIFTDQYRQHPQITHYYNEIIRFWSKLNFIIKKTLRSLKIITSLRMELLLFTTYRFIFEKAKTGEILTETGQNEQLSVYLKQLADFSWKIALKDKNKVETLSINESIPTFFIKHLLPVMNFNFLKENIKLMNQYNSKSKLTLRINTVCSNNSLETLIKLIKSDFLKEGIIIESDKEIPFILNVHPQHKREILTSKWYSNNIVIFQDKASIAIVELIKPTKGDFICDFCAAPGIKASLIAQLTNNGSKFLCNDFSGSRIRFTKKFFHQLRFLKTSLLNSDGTNLPIKKGIWFDKVLIDAPCTGSGTFLSHPELKWRQNYAFLNQNILIQKKLIQSGLKFLKPGGTMIYSTCSLYPEEGEYQISDIYDQVEPLDLPDYFSPSYKINMESLKGTGRLFPSIHNTEGFFVSRLKKK
jgi:16S rRNA (cytosine967-C5)-methyltransferase